MMAAQWRRGQAAVLIAAISLCFTLPPYAKTPDTLYPASSQRYTLRWIPNLPDPKKGGAEITGISSVTLDAIQESAWSLPEWQGVLSVHTGTMDAPALFGDYHIRPNAIRFEPRFPLQPGIKYHAIFRPSQLPNGKPDEAPLTLDFQLPKPLLTPTTRVTQVYPSSDTLPQNLLKFYIHFSAPMSRGLAYDHIRLVNEAGRKVEHPFLELPEELWDPTLTRLTLLFDHGRIKRGIRPLEEIGPALEVGKRYTLIIDSAWKDGHGNSLRAPFRKSFRVIAPDRTTPDPAQWGITPPKAGTQNPLIVTFPAPMDHALVQRMIHITAPSGAAIRGDIRLDNQEKRWVFTPALPWSRGRYTLLITTTIEDRAGNNIGKPFDVDLFDSTIQKRPTGTVQRTFMIR